LYVNGQYILTEDGDGKSGVKLSNGKYTVSLQKQGCSTVTRSVEIVCGKSSHLNVTMSCEPTKEGSIKVYVKDNSGNKLSGASVYLDNSYKGKTDSDGYLRVSNVSEGYYTVRASKSGYEDDSERIHVGAGKTETVYLYLEGEEKTGSVKAYVKDNSGNKLSGASVYLDNSYKGKTNSSGYLYIDDVPEGYYTVRASKSGYEDDSEQVYVENGKTKTIYLNLREKKISVEDTAEKYKKSGETYRIYHVKDYNLYVIVYFKLPSSGFYKPHEHITGSLVVDRSGKEVKMPSLPNKDIFYVPAVLVYYWSTADSGFQYYADEWDKIAAFHEDYAAKIRAEDDTLAALAAFNFFSIFTPVASWLQAVSISLGAQGALSSTEAYFIAQKIVSHAEDAAEYERALARAFRGISSNSASISDAKKLIPGQGSLSYSAILRWIYIEEGLKELARIANEAVFYQLPPLGQDIDKHISELKQKLQNEDLIGSEMGDIRNRMITYYRC
jgi:hypothetical protein